MRIQVITVQSSSIVMRFPSISSDHPARQVRPGRNTCSVQWVTFV